MGVSRDVTGNSAHHNEASSKMARTKRTLKAKPGTSKVAKHSANSSVEGERGRGNDSATDAESVYVEENPLPDIPSPQVTLTDLRGPKQPPKLSRHDTPSRRPSSKQQDDSDEISIVDTPTTPVTPYEPHSSSREVGGTKRRKRCETYVFTDEQEADLSEWYQLHPLFYDKTHPNYKNAEKKNNLLEERGITMDPQCTFTQLKCFFETMRTRFGKIATKKSGQGLQHLSHREKFIFNNFRFLKGHIRRSASRQSDTFTKKPQGYSGSESDGDAVSDGSDASSLPTITNPSSRKTLFKGKGKGHGKSSSHSTSKGDRQMELVEKLLERHEKSTQERASIEEPDTDHGKEVEHFSQYMQHQMKKISQHQWMDFTMDAMVLAKRYVCGEKEKEPPARDVSSADEVVVTVEQPEVIKVSANPTPMTTLANMAVVPGSSSQSIGNYLASISGQTLTSPMYTDYMSGRMALLGSPSLQHMVYPDVQQPLTDKK